VPPNVINGEMDILTLIDTVLLKAYLITDDDIVMSFLSHPNDCDIEECSEILRLHSKHLEWVTLLKTRGRHWQALSLLHKMGLNASEEIGTERTVEYLQWLGQDGENLDLIKQFSKWVLQQDPDEGLRIFTGEGIGEEAEKSLPLIAPEEVWDHLEQHANRDIRMKYLEVLIHEYDSINPKFHDSLVELYLQTISEEIRRRCVHDTEVREKLGFAVNDYVITLTHMVVEETTVKAGTEAYVKTFENLHGEMLAKIYFEEERIMMNVPCKHLRRVGTKSRAVILETGPVGHLRRKLKAFLSSSTRYNPNRMIQYFPEGELLQERCTILSRIPKHDEALEILAHKLNDFKGAEEYCDIIYEQYVEAIGGEEKESEKCDPLYIPFNGLSSLEDDQRAARDVYLTLLRVYLRPPNFAKVLRKPALKLIERKYNRINPVDVLDLLPEATQLFHCLPWIKSVLGKLNASKKKSQVNRNLMRQEYLQLEMTYRRLGRNYVEITDERLCQECNMRIGMSAFALCPRGKVVHYVCVKNK